jgi:N-methylhydantoinase A
VTFGRGSHDAQIVRRDDLGRGAVVDGPAVISEQTATTVVPPGATATVDEFGTLVVSVGEED